MRRNPPLPGAMGLPQSLFLFAALVFLDWVLSMIVPRSGPPLSLPALNRITLLRCMEIAVFVSFLLISGKGFRWLGLDLKGVKRGIKAGLAGSLILGASAMAVELGFRAAGQGSFLAMVAGPKSAHPGMLLVAAALAAPVFEEILFRGLIYASLRLKTGVFLSLTVSTVIFAAAHLLGGGPKIPWVQAVGGVAFCLAMEFSSGIVAPVIIHALGNAAIFLLPYFL